MTRNVISKDTADAEFTTPDDVAETATFPAGFRSGTVTAQSITVSHGWHMA